MDRNGAAVSDSSSGPGGVVVMAAPKQGGAASYPAALAEHRELVADKELFLDTLNKFHLALGNPLVIPKMGGKDLDLHVLYVEVTKRGGQPQVTKDRKWKEIASTAFDFDDTLTSASFVLKKYYNLHLHDYEQVHFFKSTAPSPPEAPVKKPEVINSTIRKRRLAPMPVTGSLDPAASVGNVVTGSIDGKFEQGYLVTVKVGNEKLQGVVYHVPPGHGAQFAKIAGFSPAATKQTPEQKKRKLKEELRKDPNAPRATRTGYNFFYVEERAKLKVQFPDKERELSRMVGDAWNRLTDAQKLPYQDMGAKDKERYETELREYLLKGKSGGTLPAEAAAAVEKAATTILSPGEDLTSKPVEIDCNQNQLVSSSSSEQEDPSLNNQSPSDTLPPPPPPARVETPQAPPNQWFINNS